MHFYLKLSHEVFLHTAPTSTSTSSTTVTPTTSTTMPAITIPDGMIHFFCMLATFTGVLLNKLQCSGLYLARLACLHVLPAEFFFNWRPTISGSSGPIFTILIPNCRYLIEYCGSGPFSIVQCTLPWQPILRPNWLTYLYLAHYCSQISERQWCVNSTMNWPTACKNLVNFGPVTLQVTWLIFVLV